MDVSNNEQDQIFESQDSLEVIDKNGIVWQTWKVNNNNGYYINVKIRNDDAKQCYELF